VAYSKSILNGELRLNTFNDDDSNASGTPNSYSDVTLSVDTGFAFLLLLTLSCEERGVYRVLVGKPEGKRPLGRPRRRWVDIRTDLQKVGCGYMDWIGLAQDRDRWWTLVSAVMNLRVP